MKARIAFGTATRLSRSKCVTPGAGSRARTDDLLITNQCLEMICHELVCIVLTHKMARGACARARPPICCSCGLTRKAYPAMRPPSIDDLAIHHIYHMRILAIFIVTLPFITIAEAQGLKVSLKAEPKAGEKVIAVVDAPGDITMAATSAHLRVLRASGLVEGHKGGRHV
jgi:hypothetical protein